MADDIFLRIKVYQPLYNRVVERFDRRDWWSWWETTRVYMFWVLDQKR